MNTYLPSLYYAEPRLSIEGVNLSDRAAEFADAWMALLGARAESLVCDARLCDAAQKHAQYLAQRVDTSVSMHIGSGGSHSNGRVLWAGYPLPANYEADRNNVESVTRSWDSPGAAAVSLATHEAHYDHMHFSGFWATHTHWGVGAMGEYFVCVTAP